MSVFSTHLSAPEYGAEIFALRNTFADRLDTHHVASSSADPEKKGTAGSTSSLAAISFSRLQELKLATPADASNAELSSGASEVKGALVALELEFFRLHQVQSFVKGLPNCFVTPPRAASTAGAGAASPLAGTYSSPARFSRDVLTAAQSPQAALSKDGVTDASPKASTPNRYAAPAPPARMSGSPRFTMPGKTAPAVVRGRGSHSQAPTTSVMRSSDSKKILNELFSHWTIHYRNRDVGDSVVPATRECVRSYDVGSRVVLSTAEPVKKGKLLSATTYRGMVQWDREDVAEGSCPTEASVITEVELSDLRLETPTPIVQDALIPEGESDARGCSTVVFQRALQVSMDKTVAQLAASEITKRAACARGKIADHEAQLQPLLLASEPAALTSNLLLRIHPLDRATDGAPDAVQIVLGSLKAPLLRDYYEKLRRLYRPWRQREDSCVLSSDQPREFRIQAASLDGTSTDTPESGDGCHEEVLFHLRLLRMLTRYFALAGGSEEADQNAGFHASIPPRLALSLSKNLGVTAECFASPMNANQASFCSLFYDTDRYFGGLGLFWDFHPTTGSYHVNPPFETHVMLRCAKHILSLLGKADAGPLSFFVVIPAWDHEKLAECVALLRDPQFGVRYVELSSEKSTYVDGHQHVLAQSDFTIRSNTHVFLLQNAKGSAKWKPDNFQQVLSDWCGSIGASSDGTDGDAATRKRQRE